MPLTADIFNQEPFGPVAAHALTRSKSTVAANRLPGGPSSGLCLRARSRRRTSCLVCGAGMLWINQPASPSAELPLAALRILGYGSEEKP